MVLPKAVLTAKLLAAETQLMACVDAVNQKKAPRPRFSQPFRLLWAFVIVKLVGNWRELALSPRKTLSGRTPPGKRV